VLGFGLGLGFGAVLAVGLAVGPAAAGNWTLGGKASERLEARTDFGFNEDDEPTFRSTTRLGMNLGYVTPTTRWTLGSGASYRQAIGSDDSGDGGELDGITNPRVSGSVSHSGKRQSVGARINLTRRTLNFTDAPLFLDDNFIDQPGGDLGEEPGPDPVDGGFDLVDVAEEDATETRLAFGANWNYAVSSLTSVSLATDGNIRRFSEESPDLVPSESIRFTGNVSRALDPRTSTGLSLSYRKFQSDGELTDNNTDSVTFLVNASRQLTRKHRLALSVGAGTTWADETNALIPAADAQDDAPINFQGGLTFSYTCFRNTSFVLSARRSFESTSDGRLVNANRLSAALDYGLPLTQRTSFQLGGIMSLTTDSDDLESEIGQGIRVRTGLNTRLSPAWSASTGLDLGYAREGDDDDLSAGVFLQFGRSFTLNR
jgi:hypothetical protein